MVSEGEEAALGANGTYIHQWIPESSLEPWEGISGMQFIFKEHLPKRTTKMGKGIPTELQGRHAGGGPAEAQELKVGLTGSQTGISNIKRTAVRVL